VNKIRVSIINAKSVADQLVAEVNGKEDYPGQYIN
jgi:hypothetical protein